MWLIEEEIYFALEVQLPECLREALKLQAERTINDEEMRALSRRIADRVTKAIEGALDVDLQPPTAPQIAFARAVSARLGVPLPKEVLLQRKAMGSYLDRYSALFKTLASKKS